MNKLELALALLIVAFFASYSVKADDDLDYYLSLGSWHEHGDFNQFNPGIGVSYKFLETDSDSRIYGVGGIYYNSERRTSVYSGVGASIEPVSNVRLGVELLAVTGYQSYKVIVAPVPNIEISHFKVLVIPPYKTSPLTLGLQYRF